MKGADPLPRACAPSPKTADSATELDPLDSAGLGLGVVDPEAYDVSRLVPLERGTELGDALYCFPLDFQDDVGSTAALTVNDLAIRGTTGGHVRHHQPPLA